MPLRRGIPAARESRFMKRKKVRKAKPAPAKRAAKSHQDEVAKFPSYGDQKDQSDSSKACRQDGNRLTCWMR